MDARQLLDQLLGAGKGTQTAPNANGLLPPAMRGTGALAGGLAAGGLVGLLVGNKKMRKSMGKLAGGAVGLGGAAALGALAYRAYNNWQTGRPGQLGVTAAATGLSAGMGAAAVDGGQPFELALIKAMVAAANADRHIDAEEQRRIFDSVDKLNIDAQDKAFLFDTLRNPPTIDDIAVLPGSPEQAAELYLASRLAIDPDLPQEQQYLDALAQRLSLPPDLVAELDRQLETRADDGPVGHA